MFFTLSKFLWFVLSPFNIGLFLLTGAMICLHRKKRRLAQIMGVASWAVFVVFGVLPTGQALLLFLESRYQPPADMPWRADGIILLGGAIDTDLGVARGTPQLNGQADRIAAFVDLARRYPWAKLVFTAGIGEPSQNGVPEGQMIKQVLESYRFKPGTRFVIEDKARTTYENALYSKDLVNPKPGQTWFLVTSAWHMPRAVGAFRAQGWDVIPIPADYLTTGKLRPTPNHSGFLGNMALSHVAIKEIAGIALYAATGKWAYKTPPREEAPAK